MTLLELTCQKYPVQRRHAWAWAAAGRGQRSGQSSPSVEDKIITNNQTVLIILLMISIRKESHFRSWTNQTREVLVFIRVFEKNFIFSCLPL